MTALDLTAVCERHGIAVHETTSAVVVGGWMAHYPPDDFDRFGIGASPEEAVCNLLKARWGMTVQWSRGLDEWRAYTTPDVEVYATTELDAVVSLADRLRS
jgi:hypothetical protein